jgi:hypothetical protein
MLKKLFPIYFLFTLLVVACGSQPDLKPVFPINLASFNENGVTVNITLVQDPTGQVFLAATFTPEDGWHLYSKDLPRNGLDGMGRPTLLELAPGSQLKAVGALTESIGAEQEDVRVGLLVYPAGPVTLRLPVILPEESGWFDEQVSVTYMACSQGMCRPPVIDKLVSMRVPGAEEIHP